MDYKTTTNSRRATPAIVAVVLLALALLLPAGLTAQEDGESGAVDEEALFGSSEDDLFGGTLVVEPDETAETDAGVEDLLTSNAPTVGGRFSLSLTLAIDPAELDSFDERLARDYSLAPTIFVDARPDPDFRILLKSGIDYTADGATITVEELFADATLADWLFLRAGKQNMGWGVGYFWSPADLVSLEEIDPDDPEAELEGPVAVRLHLPRGTTNTYAYAMLDQLPTTGYAGYAGKLDFVLGASEVTFGGYGRRESVSGAMATWSGSLRDVDLFAEAVARYGSTITIVREEGTALVTDARADEWFPLATAGFRYAWSDDEGDFSLSLLGQYYFNGEGYDDPSILADPRVAALLGSGDLSPRDLQGTGRHYGAASLRWSGALGSDLSPSAFWIGNVSDGSGRVQAEVAWRLTDVLTLTPGYSYAYGDEGDEYAPAGAGHTITLRASLGGPF